MSEVLGTVLLTAITVVLVTGFGIAVFGSFTGSDSPSPTGAFSVDARPGLPYVNVSFREGTSFAMEDARFILSLDGDHLPEPTVPGQLASDRLSPGDVLRFALPSGVVATGASLRFFAIDADTGDVIGLASATVPATGSLPSFLSAAVGASTITFSPANIFADGANITTIEAALSATHGLAMVDGVLVDLTAVGGGSFSLNDDGVMGDAVAGDGVYSGQFTASSVALPEGAATGNAVLPVTVTDIFGKSTSAGSGTLALTAATDVDLTGYVDRAIANATSATNILGVGGISRNLPSSASIHSLTITNFTWRDVTELDNDIILYRVTDMTDTTKAWAAAVYFDQCALANGGGPYGAINEVVFTRDGVANRASWRPTSPTNCWTVDYDTVLDLTRLNRSVNATGASPTWTVVVTDNDGTIVPGDPGVWDYANASIGAINQGIVPYFGDTQPTANPHGALDDLGLGTAQVAWTRVRAPTASFTVTVSGLFASVDASASAPAPGTTITGYQWDWGDGATTTGLTSFHTYASGGTYTVTLSVTGSTGSVGTTAQTLTANRAPAAVAALSATATRTITASSLGSTDPDGHAITYTWAWGDGTETTTTSTSQAKTYAAPGTYTVTLYANDSFGGSGSATAIAGSAPTAAFTSTASGLTVATNAATSAAPAGEAITYSWDWGDASAATTGVASSRTYGAVGTSPITLTVTSTFGTTATASANVARDGNNWLVCPPTTLTTGSVASCAGLQSATDSAAVSTLSETNPGGGLPRQANVTFGMAGYAEAGKTHTLQARAAQASGTAETLALQVRDSVTGQWATHFTWATTTVTTSAATALTDAQWNNGSPVFRFVDANCLNLNGAACTTTSDNNVATWSVDWVRVVSS